MSIRRLELSDVSQLRDQYGLPVPIIPTVIIEPEDKDISQEAPQTPSNHPLGFVSRELTCCLAPFLGFREMVALSRVSKEMPSILSLVKAAHISNPNRLFTISSKELLFLVKKGGLPLFIERLELYFKNMETKELKEKILLSRYNEMIRKQNFALAYALHIFAEQSGLNLGVQEKNLKAILATKRKHEFALQHFFALTKCKKIALLVNDRCIELSKALHHGNIQKAEKEFAFVKMIEQDRPDFPPWGESWKWVFGAITGLTYEDPPTLEKAMIFVIDHSIREVNPIQAILTAWTRIVSRGSLRVDQPKWILDFLRERQLLTEEEIGEVIVHTIIYWLHRGDSWQRTDQIAQEIFSFAQKQNIDLSQLGERIGQNMWSVQHYSTCTAFAHKNQLEIPRYWRHAATQLVPGLKYFSNPAQEALFNYTDNDYVQ